jgi:hypothetical protein
MPESTRPTDEQLTRTAQVVSANAMAMLMTDENFAAKVSAMSTVITKLPEVPQNDEAEALIVMTTAMTTYLLQTTALRMDATLARVDAEEAPRD